MFEYACPSSSLWNDSSTQMKPLKYAKRDLAAYLVMIAYLTALVFCGKYLVQFFPGLPLL